MAESMKLQFVLDAEDRTKTAMKSVQANLDKVERKLKTLKPTFQKMAVAGTVGFVAISAGIWKATQSAVASQEIFSKFDTVFDDVSVKAEKVANDLRDNWGLAESTAKDLLSSTGDLLSGFGFTGDAALTLSEKTQKLAIDLASFTNLQGGSARASTIITKALLGERDSLISLGVKILDVDVKQRLLEEGKEELEGMALRQAKAEITLQLIMEQSGKAIGDYERTSESAANQQRLLQERIKELSEKIGTLFIPILKKLIDTLLPIINKTVAWIEENPKLTKVILLAVVAITALVAIVGFLGLALPVIIIGFGLLLSPITIIIGAVALLTTTGIILWKKWDLIKEGLAMIWEEMSEIFQKVWDSIKNYFSGVWESMGNVVTSVFEGIKNTITNSINWIIEKINYFIRQANRVVRMVPGASMVSEIAKLAEGGIVTKPTLAMIGENGPEAVIPLNKGFAGAGIGGITINVMGGNYLSKDATAMFGESLANELKRNIKL